MLNVLLCRRKNLISVKWSYDTSAGRAAAAAEAATEDGEDAKPKAPRDDEWPPICPSCKKQLSNNTLLHRAC